MKPQELATIATSLRTLELSADTTEEDHDAAMQVLSDFNDCMTGLIRFSGETPWERHPSDELLLVLAGKVDVTLLQEDGASTEIPLAEKSLLVLPRGLWHRQSSDSGVTLLFVTAKDGDDVSWAEDPRVGAASE